MTDKAQSAPPQDTGALSRPPLFYVQPEPLSATGHKEWSIRGAEDFSFAAGTNSVPLTAPEFGMAARHYPIIFLGDVVPTCVLGYEPGRNLFVDDKGRWDEAAYIPAYVRRYPFILMGAQGQDRLTLGIDQAGRSDKPEGRALFAGDKESDVIKNALEMCEQFHNAHLFTRDFSNALKEVKIVEEQTMQAETGPGKVENVATFQRVNEEKFRNLPDATILEWRKNGFLHAIYFHLQSMNNWNLLLLRHAHRVTSRPAT